MVICSAYLHPVIVVDFFIHISSFYSQEISKHLLCQGTEARKNTPPFKQIPSPPNYSLLSYIVSLVNAL